MPHITEELWQRMGYGSGSIQFASVADLRVDLPPADDALRFATAVYEATSITRNLRAEYRIASNKKIRIVLKPELTGDFTVFGRLCGADPLEVMPDYQAARGEPVAITPIGQVFLPLEGSVDLDAEKQRLTREIAKLEEELETVRKKLANENFVNRAPAAVVEEHRKRETDFLGRLEQLRDRLSSMAE
jgi:valyl-tRNA synthetase